MILEKNGLVWYSTAGASMFPFIRANDLVLIKKVSPEAVQPGDTILYESDANIKVCHRVVEVKEEDRVLWFYTRGYKDGPGVSRPVRQDRLLGKVVAIKRQAEFISLNKKLELISLKLDCFRVEAWLFTKKKIAQVPYLKAIYRKLKNKN